MNDPFRDLGKKRSRWATALVAAACLLAVAGGVWARRRHDPAPKYLTARVSLGDVQETVEATGTVQPLLQVNVGAQVSGRVASLFADFNDRVRQGQILAELDPTAFRAAVAQARAAVLAAQAQLRRARANESVTGQTLARAQALRAQGLNAPADLDAARAAHEVAAAEVGVAQAEIARARAALASAETNLTYTRIRAPIDGVVIQRSVEVGVTVAASLQTPTLFVIANDLSRMQIIADIDEADVGKLREHMLADARVDAFPGESFRGEVTALRYGPVTTAGVVTYPAVLYVSNPDFKLRPGMTATVTVTSQRHVGVLRVPNAALRFRPGVARGGAGRGARPAPTERGGRDGRVYVLRHGRLEAIPVRVGITDNVHTEVSGATLRAGLEVVTDETDAAPRGGAGPSSGGGRQTRRLF